MKPLQANSSGLRPFLSQMPSLGLNAWLRQNGLATILIVSYVFMALLVVEQGRTIDNQRSLIRQLFSDSVELNAAKMRAQAAQHH